MLIGGLQKLTLLDYPGEIACIIFTKGCNFRCRFCYNPLLVVPNHTYTGTEKDHPITEDDLFRFLKSRLGKLDAVVISGGEPTLHADLPEFIAKIKKLNFKVKLDTNGTNPLMLEKLIKKNLLNYIAMDIKGAPKKYQKITACQDENNLLPKIKKSIKLIINSGIPYEFRSTLIPKLITQEDINKMGELIQGANKWYLQEFKSDVDLIDKNLEGQKKYSLEEMQAMQKQGQNYVKKCILR